MHPSLVSSLETARGVIFSFLQVVQIKRRCKSQSVGMITEALTRKFVMFMRLYNYSIIQTRVIGEVAAKCRLYFAKSDLVRRRFKLSFRRRLTFCEYFFTHVIDSTASVYLRIFSISHRSAAVNLCTFCFNQRSK